MNDLAGMTRRSFVACAVSAAALSGGRPGAAATALAPTARQTPGPFYPRTQPLDADADLVHVAGRSEPATGHRHPYRGARSRSPAAARCPMPWWRSGNAMPSGAITIRGTAAASIPIFRGTDAPETDGGGGYRFRTIRPVPYPGRTPHIHFAIAAPNFPRLTTQMYVAGEPRNERDFVLGRIRDPRARASVIVPLAPDPDGESEALAGTFDIVLGGTG